MIVRKAIAQPATPRCLGCPCSGRCAPSRGLSGLCPCLAGCTRPCSRNGLGFVSVPAQPRLDWKLIALLAAAALLAYLLFRRGGESRKETRRKLRAARARYLRQVEMIKAGE